MFSNPIQCFLQLGQVVMGDGAAALILLSLTVCTEEEGE